MYHCFLAITVYFGYESRNQTCTVALVEMLQEEGKIKLDEKFIDMLKSEEIQERHESSVIESREEYTYGIETSVDKVKIDKILKSCKELIDTTKEILYNKKFTV